MTVSELKKLDIVTEHGIFTPMYTFDDYDIETDEYINLEIIKTAEEVYQEWLYNNENPPVEEPTEMEVLQQENKLLKAQVDALNATTDFHEELIAEMAMILYA